MVDTVIEAPEWETAGLETLAMDSARAVLDHLGISEIEFEICIMGCDDDRISELNAEFRGKPAPTNVLSWPFVDRSRPGKFPELPDQPQELGDIAIAYETCAKEAEKLKRSFADHTRHLIVHGILHLLGFDHETAEDAAIMEPLETEILATMGVADPYCG